MLHCLLSSFFLRSLSWLTLLSFSLNFRFCLHATETNQRTYQSPSVIINQPTNQIINLTNQPMKWQTNKSINQSINQSNKQLTLLTILPTDRQPDYDQLAKESIHQTTNQPTQTTKKPISKQTIKQRNRSKTHQLPKQWATHATSQLNS